jgi:23S rRNA pseudouridine2605 synthase
MQQRRPRLGDVLDDYCPRERRVTNHVVVAMIEDQVKQTRCTTCDGDHDYKQARTPSPRKPKTVAAIQDGAEAFEAKPVLTAPARAAEAPAAAAAEPVALDTGDAFEPAPAAVAGDHEAQPPVAMAAAADTGMAAQPDPQIEPSRDDEGPVHRRLIRATLPRPEGHVPERKEPEFTIRQQGARGGGHEVDGNRVGYRPKGHRQGGQGGGHSRFGGQRHGSGQQQQRQGGRPGPNGQRGGRPDGMGNTRGQRGPGSGRRRGGR